MGCVSSKLVKKEHVREIRVNNGGDHVVSLTSTTYGLLKLDQHVRDTSVSETKKPVRPPLHEEPEIINTWELMEDLEDCLPVSRPEKINSPKSRGFLGKSWMSPKKSVDKMDSPRKSTRFGGKENRVHIGVSPNLASKSKNILETPRKSVLRLNFPLKSEESSMATPQSQRRRSVSPLFDPDLVAKYERELCQEKEQIKMVISPVTKTRKSMKLQESEKFLKIFPENCPPRGENSVVVYTTTLRGIRKTFEDCNKVRAIFESHLIRVSERDISMHSAFKEEIRGIMGTKQVKIPAVFIRGRLIGGVEEVVKLEEEGKLGILLEDLPAVARGGGCVGCGGLRFVMCVVCNGSCKVMDEEKRKMVKCSECNENGLIICPLCP